ncbi:MAG TPA: AMP-binding protein [Vicinamibacterales bacterium]|nr:AMP-binding protein [Vicinamibacterales bacterium]
MPSGAFEFGGEIAWRPSADVVERSRLTAFMRRHGLPDFKALLERSTSDLEWFWRAVFDDLGIEFYEPFTQVVDLSKGPAWARWCVGARLNIVHNCLDKWAGTATDARPAIRWEGEEGAHGVLTYAELRAATNRCANALRSLGVRKGDRVALFLPMGPELAAAFFAIAKIGAVVLPLFSGYGADAVAARLQDAGATVVITADGFWRRGQRVSMKLVADEAVAASPSVRHVIVVSRLGTAAATHARDRLWSDLVDVQPATCETERTEAEDPLMLIYTSGTTGRPKGAVHTHCGFPIKSAQDMAHAFDVQPGDTMYWVSDIGWMMGPWELFGMALIGGTSVLYDGAPDHPGPDRLWALVERHRVNILGVSPTLIRALMKHGEAPVRAHDLSSLRILGSTGEPWNPEPWRWLFDVAGGGRLPIINYSGGTEVSGGLVAGNVLTALKPAAFAGPPPGIAADVVDDQGRPVRNQVGELIVRAPWIGMTRGFWHDPQRYEQTYWSRFPGVWVHGDWAAVDDDGLWYILGRSDDTIKIAGKRLGPAEVESVLVEHPAVLEAAAIGVPDEMKGQALVCFCVLRAGHEASPELEQALMALVATRLGKPLKPAAVRFVRDLPKTRNAKVMRRVIRTAYLGEAPGDLSSLENPQAIDDIAAHAPSRRG